MQRRAKIVPIEAMQHPLKRPDKKQRRDIQMFQRQAKHAFIRHGGKPSLYFSDGFLMSDQIQRFMFDQTNVRGEISLLYCLS